MSSGKFINTQRHDVLDSLVTGLKDRMDNPYYIHTDKKPTVVDYYHINKEGSTLDEGLKIHQEQLGPNSPFKYDLIEGFYLYGGFTQIELQLDNSELGLQEDGITNTSYILPNTITPIPGDYFRITYLNKPYLFKILTVNIDSIESGGNFYKIDYEYSKSNTNDIDRQVVNKFKFLIDNVGTNFTTILKKVEYDYISILQEITNKLKEYYSHLYYSHRVQTFISHGNSCSANFYDPFLIEFIIRNNILQGDSRNYVHVTQQMGLPSTFGIDYDRSFFRSLESKSIKGLSDRLYVVSDEINQPLSILCMRLEQYHSLSHVTERWNKHHNKFELFTKNLITRIKNKDVRDENIILSAYNKFKGNIFIEENITVDKFSKAFKGMLSVLKNEDTLYYNGIINIIKEDELSTDENLFRGLLRVTNTSQLVDKSFAGNLVLSSNVKTTLYDGIIKILQKQDMNQDTVYFRGTIFIDNSILHNRNMVDNLIIKYFNGIDISMDDINKIEEIQYVSDSILYYYIPILIFILEDYIRVKLHKTLE